MEQTTIERMHVERENELVLQAQKGSTKAFTELEKQYRYLVFKVTKDVLRGVSTHRMLNADAEDAAQDAFEYAFVHIKDYKPGRFYRWLWSVARISALRSRSKLWNRRYHETDFDDECDGFSPSAEDCANSWDEAVNEIEQYLKKYGADLPKVQIGDLEMYVDGFKPREIAKRTGRSSKTVRQNIWRAKERVKKALENVDVWD